MGGGILICGLVSISLPWRYGYWISVALIGAATVLIILTFPETEFKRPAEQTEPISIKQHLSLTKGGGSVETASSSSSPPTPQQRSSSRRPRSSYAKDLRIFNGVHTRESLWKLLWRPVVMLALPPILWATLVMAVTIGFLVAITSNFASAFSDAYGFAAWQAGLCFIASILGSLVGIFFGGAFSDMVADWLTRRNGGVREPEMRLPAMMVSVVTAPLALVLYGEGIGLRLHWMCATVGLGLRKWAPARVNNCRV